MINPTVADYFGNDELAYAAKLESLIVNEWSNDAKQWIDCVATNTRTCLTAWAEESIKMACQWAYKDAPEGAELGTEYWTTRMPFVNYQLAKAGVRLAAVLNSIFQ